MTLFSRLNSEASTEEIGRGRLNIAHPDVSHFLGIELGLYFCPLLRFVVELHLIGWNLLLLLFVLVFVVRLGDERLNQSEVLLCFSPRMPPRKRLLIRRYCLGIFAEMRQCVTLVVPGLGGVAKGEGVQGVVILSPARAKASSRQSGSSNVSEAL